MLARKLLCGSLIALANRVTRQIGFRQKSHATNLAEPRPHLVTSREMARELEPRAESALTEVTRDERLAGGHTVFALLMPSQHSLYSESLAANVTL